MTVGAESKAAAGYAMEGNSINMEEQEHNQQLDDQEIPGSDAEDGPANTSQNPGPSSGRTTGRSHI